MMMRDCLFLLISNVFGGCGARKRPGNDDEGFFVLLFSNVLGRGCGAGGPLVMIKDFFISADFECFRKGVQIS